MDARSFQNLIHQLQHKERCWEAMLELKFVTQKDRYPDIIHALTHPHSLVRWVMAEHCGELCLQKSADLLFQLLLDTDPQVRKTAYKALKSMSTSILPCVITHLDHPQVGIRKVAHHLLLTCKEDALDALKDSLPTHGFFVQQRLLNLIWKISPFKCEAILFNVLDLPAVEQHAILYLGQLKSKKAIQPLLKKYEQPNCRSFILAAFEQIGADHVYPIIAKSLVHPALETQALCLAKTIGSPLLPYIQACVSGIGSDQKQTWQNVISKLKNIDRARVHGLY
ncbi:MAG: HEAT repeat domain-containing protein [bacterium]